MLKDPEKRRLYYRQYMKEYRLKNKEKLEPVQRAYNEKRLANPENVLKAREVARLWYEKNREYAKERMRERSKKNYVYRGRPKAEKHYRWQGDKPTYQAAHKWIQSELGKPNKCDLCGDTEKSIYDWANKYHQYGRTKEEWLRLCRKCHCEWDKENTDRFKKKMKLLQT